MLQIPGSFLQFGSTFFDPLLQVLVELADILFGLLALGDVAEYLLFPFVNITSPNLASHLPCLRFLNVATLVIP